MSLQRNASLPITLLATLMLAACGRQPEAPVPATPQATAAAAGQRANVEEAGPSTPQAATPQAATPQAGSKATPSLQIVALDGTQYDLASHRGKWVVINFWATWCAPCLKEMPELSALDAMRDHIEVIGLAYEDIDADAMRDFLKEHPVVYPVAIVDTFDPPKDFDTPRGLPMTYLIGPNGTVAKKILGPVTAKGLEDAIAEAGGPKPSAPIAPAKA